MSLKNPFVDAENHRAVVISRQEREIRSFYEEAYLDTLIKIGNLDKNDAGVNRIFLNGLKDELKSKFKSIGERTESVVKSGATSVVERVLENNKTFLNNMGFVNYRANPKLVTGMVDYVVTGKLYGGKWSLSSAIWNINDRTMQDINKIVARGILDNKSTFDIAKSLERYLNPSAMRPVIHGVNGVVDYNAQRLARTMIQHAYQEAFVSATIDNPFIEAYQWITSGMPNVCPLCIERADTDQFGLGEGIFPKDELPLDHPNGNCTFDIVSSWNEDTARQAVFDWAFGGLDDPELSEKLDEFAETFE